MTRKATRISRPVAIETVPLDAVQRILRRCAVASFAPQCWIWQGYADPAGYGCVKVAGRACWVHRVVYAAFAGGLAGGLEIHHRCGHRRCCNPVHLEPVAPHRNRSNGSFRTQGRSRGCAGNSARP